MQWTNEYTMPEVQEVQRVQRYTMPVEQPFFTVPQVQTRSIVTQPQVQSIVTQPQFQSVVTQPQVRNLNRNFFISSRSAVGRHPTPGAKNVSTRQQIPNQSLKTSFQALITFHVDPKNQIPDTKNAKPQSPGTQLSAAD